MGSGFFDALIKELSQLIGKAGGKNPTAHVPTTDIALRTATWFAPRFVVEVLYRGIGRQHLLRQPSLKMVRRDKDVADLADSDRGGVSENPSKPRFSKAPANKAGTGSTTDGVQAAQGGRVPPNLSSPGKIIFPDIRATKQNVWDYYSAVMEHLLPEIQGRPLSVIRCPSGTGKPCFFQKHHTAGLELVSLAKLKEDSGVNAFYLVPTDAASVMELVQFNALEFHPWGSRADNPDQADRVVFDLDPGPDVPFEEVTKAATDIRKLLTQLELESFLRVSGGKGLHVVVPLNPGCDGA